jgi:hypothetical protein
MILNYHAHHCPTGRNGFEKQFPISPTSAHYHPLQILRTTLQLLDYYEPDTGSTALDV